MATNINKRNMQAFIEYLLGEMTLEEKISQMLFEAPGIERLGIAPYNWWNECLHGLGRAGKATVFPQSIGLAAAWDTELLGEIATAISDEARAKHHEAKRHDMHNIYAGLTFWSPTINIFRDPRWGRGQETYGEDPYLTASMAVCFVRGLQGEDPDCLKLVATPKHFAVHGGPESTRHHFDAQVDEWAMREFYLFAFEAAVKLAKARSVMGAYNRVNGEPCCASPTLLTKILREEWGFDGYVVSDCEAIRDIFENHRVVDTAAEAAALAVNNDCDLNCGTIYQALLEAHEKGLISEETIDRSVRRLMTARFQLGMFHRDDEVRYAQIPYEIINSPAHRSLSLQAAKEAIVLLKNEDGVLPLSKDVGSIAVIGPNADSLASLLGNYNGTPENAITPLMGIRDIVSPKTSVTYSQGCEIASGMASLSVIPEKNLLTMDSGKLVQGLSASYYGNDSLEGKPIKTSVDKTIDFVWLDSSPISGRWGEPFSAVWEGFLQSDISGKFRIGVNGYSDYHLKLDGRTALIDSFIHHPQLRTIEVELEAGVPVPLHLAYVNRGLDPQIQLLWSPLGEDHRTEALQAAVKADVIVAVMGLSPALEGEEMPVEIEGFSGGDRTDIKLPSTQSALLRELQVLGKPVVLVLLNGSALALGWVAESIPAIVECWYPGQEGGWAIAEVLFGDYNPGGKLPVTFYNSVDDLPPFDDYSLADRTYRYCSKKPVYPFGHGLSYTSFEMSDFKVDRTVVQAGDEVSVSLVIENTGNRAGDEVVQVYLRQPESDTPRPKKQLVGFQRVHLEPGQRRRINFTFQAAQFAFYSRDAELILAPGTYKLMVGTSSADQPLQASVVVRQSESPGEVEKVFFSEATVE